VIYEVVNPSDQCTIEAENELLACCAIVVLGEGAYGLYDEKGTAILPIFLLQDPQRLIDWLNERGISPDKMDEFYAKNGEEVADILESIAYGSIQERKAILAVCEGKSAKETKAALAKWNDEKRSSLNDISKACRQIAKAFRKKAKESQKTG
jgi:uncharacterized protein YukE